MARKWLVSNCCVNEFGVLSLLLCP